MQQRAAQGRRVPRNMGIAAGSIMAIIIPNHISRKVQAASNQLWPPMGIHIMEIVQPPGISLSQHIERQK